MIILKKKKVCYDLKKTLVSNIKQRKELKKMADYKKHKDEELIKLLQSSSPICDAAFSEIYKRYSDKLNAFCRFKSDNIREAEEIFQDAWMKFFNYARAGNRIDNIQAFLYKIARNISIDKFRAKAGKQYLDSDNFDWEQLASPFNLQSKIESDDLLRLISIGISNLDEKSRDAFVMQWFGGLSYSEIAEINDESSSAVKMRCHRALKELIKMLKPYILELSDSE